MRSGIPPSKRAKLDLNEQNALAHSPSLVQAGQMPSAALLMREAQLAKIAGEEKKGYVVPALTQYLNIQVAGNPVAGTVDVTSPATTPVYAEYDKTYQYPLLDKASDYKLAVIRVRLPTSEIPLFYYTPGSCVVSMVIPAGGAGAGTYSSALAPVAADPSLQALNPLPIHYVQQFINALNVALINCHVLARLAGFGGSPGMFTTFSFNSQTSLMTVNYEQTW
jgi:hypothetical protein